MHKNMNFHLQVSELVKQYRREHITVWGNANYEIVGKCYKEVILSKMIQNDLCCY